MKILLGSHHYFPSTGGIETVTNLLAREFVRRGHQVRIVTETGGTGAFAFDILRQPRSSELLAAVRWCDLFLQNNISLRTLWPLLFVRRPLFIIHQTWIAAPDGRHHWSHDVKRFALRFAQSFAISEAIARALPVPSVRVGNPYDDSVFKIDPQSRRTKEVIFVGRLVSDKAVDLLLEAIALLRETELRPSVTIVGDGPERARLEQQARISGIAEQVSFVGASDSRAIAALLNEHSIIVVPSRWAEPFGIVAIEGIACGCAVVGSAGGGLPEAIGPCGVTFPNGDSRALACELAALLRHPARCEALRAASGAHLAQFTPVHVADIYLEALAAALR